MNILRTAFVAVAAITLSAMSTTAQSPHVEWVALPDALSSAPDSNRLIVLDLYTDWCGWCKRMERDTYADDAVVAYIAEHFIASRLNPEKEGKVTYDDHEYSFAEFGSALGVRGYPTTAFFNQKGELLTTVAGYIGPDEFLKILRFFGDGSYQSMSWEEYRKGS